MHIDCILVLANVTVHRDGSAFFSSCKLSQNVAAGNHIKQHVYKHDLLLESVFVLLDNKVATAEFEVLQK